MKIKKLTAIVASAFLGLSISNSDLSAGNLSIFEPGTNNISSNWIEGGSKRGWSEGVFDSNRTFSYDPINNGDGIEMKLSGPTNGLSYGAEEWVRTTTDLRGNDWLINLSFKANVIEPYNNRVQIQITDGYIDTNGHLYWMQKPIPGTNNLITDQILGFSTGDPYSILYDLTSNSWPNISTEYSIDLQKDGTVRVYDQYNKTGNMIN